MITLYYTLVIGKRRTLSSIPEKFRQEVLAMLVANSYDENGDKVDQIKENG